MTNNMRFQIVLLLFSLLLGSLSYAQDQPSDPKYDWGFQKSYQELKSITDKEHEPELDVQELKVFLKPGVYKADMTGTMNRLGKSSKKEKKRKKKKDTLRIKYVEGKYIVSEMTSRDFPRWKITTFKRDCSCYWSWYLERGQISAVRVGNRVGTTNTVTWSLYRKENNQIKIGNSYEIISKDRRSMKFKWTILGERSIFRVKGNYTLQNPLSEDKEVLDKNKDSSPSLSESRFLDQIGESEYDSIEPDKKSYKIRWNFQEKKDYVYEFSERAKLRHRSGMFSEQDGAKNQDMTNEKGEGTLIVRSNGDGLADLILKKMSSEGQSKTVQQNVQPLVIQGMNEAGNSKDSNISNTKNRWVFLELLLPVPPDSIQNGETIRVDRTMPFNAMGSSLYVQGHSEMTYTRMVEIDGNRCIQLDMSTDISNMDIPEEMEGDYEVNLTGRSRYFFNTDRGVFQQGKQAFLMDVKINAPVMNVDMSTESLIQLELRR